MSRFLGKSAAQLSPYTPGEQPQDKRYIKLNTNECPYPPSPEVTRAIAALDTADLRLYPDPEVKALARAIAKAYNLEEAQVFPGAGSDEVLGYGFMAFFDQGDPVYFPDITYGFYPVYAQLCGLNAIKLPLGEDFTVALAEYMDVKGHIVIANPNAPTGMALEPEEIESLLRKVPNRLVIVDEAYVDFAPGKTCIPLLDQYDNLLIVQTFSKSRALAGMRIGCGLGHPDLIAALNRIKFSFNPYNLDRAAIAAGIAAVEDTAYFTATLEKVIRTRETTSNALHDLGFRVLPSQTNFLFVSYPHIDGQKLYEMLKEKGVLVRHFTQAKICNFVRITIGTDEEMKQFLEIVRDLL